eukprot:1009998-Rhodomonas_salina.4
MVGLCCGVCGTMRVYGAMRGAVLSWCMVCGTELAYGAMRCAIAVCGTELAYGAAGFPKAQECQRQASL